MKLSEIINFNPIRKITKGKEAPFVEMAALPQYSRDIAYVYQKEFNGSGTKFKNGDTLLARITPCLENGKTAKVNCLKTSQIGHGSTEFIVMEAKDPEYDEDFIYYLSRWNVFRDYAIARMEGSSGRQRVDWRAIADFECDLPNKEIRRKIGYVLKQFDDKIAINNKINTQLEVIAQTLFKSWFIDYEPVKAKVEAILNGKDPEIAAMMAICGKTNEEIAKMPLEKQKKIANIAKLFPEEMFTDEIDSYPKGWKKSEIGKEVDVLGGSTPSSKKSEFWDGGTNHWATPKDLSGLKNKILIDTERKITDEGVKKISSGVLPLNTVLLSSRAPVGYLAINKIPISINQGFIAMVCNKKIPAEFILNWTYFNMNEILRRASGTTFLEISKSNFRPIKIIVPKSNLITLYYNIVSKMYAQIEVNSKENVSITSLRDSLLSELIKSKITV